MPAADVRARSIIREFWIVWLIPIIILVVVTFGFSRWGTGSQSSDASKTIHPVSAANFDIHPADNRTMRVVTDIFETRANPWAHLFMYNCTFAKNPGWRVELKLFRLSGTGTSSTEVKALGTGLYATSTHAATTLSSVFHVPGAGRYRFEVIASRSCIWQLRAPPDRKALGKPGL